MKEIPLVDLNAQYEKIKNELHELWNESLNSMNLYLGPNVQKFEEEFASYNKIKHCISVGSGTDAVHLALRAAGIGKGDEVITPSYTFFATVESIIHSGAYPVLLDIDPQYYGLSPDAVSTYIEENCRMKEGKLKDKNTGKILKAILPVHIYGQTVDMKAFKEIAENYQLKIIEDACQAHGATYGNKKAGTIGDAGAFSFYFSKNLSALGEGGAIITDNDEIAETIRKLRQHGQNEKYTHEMIGFNSRLDELQAAVLKCKLKYLNTWNQKRREIAACYNEELKDLPLELPEEKNWGKHVYHLYVIQTKRRNELFDYLKRNNIGCSKHYAIPCHLQKPLKKLGYKMGDLPETESVAEKVISIPMHPHLSDKDISTIIKKIRDFFEDQ